MGAMNTLKDGPDVFSPKDLVELGRPGAAIANADGNLALVSYSKYSLQDKKNSKSVFVVSLDSHGKSVQIPLDKGGEFFWISSSTLANVVESQDGRSEIYAYDINIETISNSSCDDAACYTPPVRIGSIPTTASNFRFSSKTGNLVFSAYVYPDGNLHTVSDQDREWEERGNSALVYDTTYVRHWDVWQGKKRPQLFSVKLTKENDGNWKVGDNFTAPLRGTKHYNPVEPFGGLDDFDASNSHIVYTTKDPELPEAWHTKQNVYIVPISGDQKPVELTSGKQGATHAPVFNTEGTKVAWLELDEDGYESDRSKIVIYDLKQQVRFTVTQGWDRSPSELAFSKDDDFLYLTAGEEAKVKIFALPVPPTPAESTTHSKLDSKYSVPVAVTHSKAATGLQTLPGGRLLFSQSSFTSPNDAYVITGLKAFEDAILSSVKPRAIEIKRITHFSAAELSNKNLSEGEEFLFKGAEGKTVQGWTLKPKGWKEGETKKWPIVLLIHGGPQGAWVDQWSTRWNPNVFAQQGYFVAMINPTGSTSFGQNFTDAITRDWGGKPFIDMINGWKYVLDNHPEIDDDRAVAAGASWGGYAVNWIQGHPEFGFNFKALVCHDGVFDSTYNGYSTDELFFFNHDWGGRPWDPESKKLAQKMSPANFVHKWSTPQLVIHGSKDYRLPETEGIGAFHALQQLGIQSRLVIFPDENHWVLKHGNSLKWHYEVFRWFDRDGLSVLVVEFPKMEACDTVVIAPLLGFRAMDQDSFRRLLQASKPNGSNSSNLGLASTSRSKLSIPSRQKKVAETVVTQPTFKPRNIKRYQESKNRDGEKDNDGEDQAKVDLDGEHHPPVKGLDFALLERERAKAQLLSTDDVDELEQAFAESSAHHSEPPARKKRTREEIIRELKQKREAETGQVNLIKDDTKLEEAKHQGKFRPIGFKRVESASSGKKRKDRSEGEKKKKRKINDGKNDTIVKDPLGSPKLPPRVLPGQPKLPECQSLDEDFDIFADAGEYTGIELDDDDDNAGEKTPEHNDHGALPPSIPQARWIEMDDEPDYAAQSKPLLPPNLQPPPSEPVRTEVQVDLEEQPIRLAPLESSAVPSIKDLLEMDEATSRYEKKQRRKDKLKKKSGKGGSDDD